MSAPEGSEASAARGEAGPTPPPRARLPRRFRGPERAAAAVLLVSLARAATGFPPPERTIDWSRAGVENGIPEVPVVVRLSDYHPAADGRTDDADAFNRAIRDARPPGAVLVPPGTYLLGSQIRLKSGIVLRGSGPETTHLVFDAPDNRWGGVLHLRGNLGEPLPLPQGAAAGSRTIELGGAPALAAGDEIAVSQENDPAQMYTKREWNQDWAQRAAGQIVRVVSVAGGVISLDVPLRLDYTASLKPHVQRVEPIENAGIESLHVLRRDGAEDCIADIRQARNCWIRNCFFENCTRSHVHVMASRFLTVRDSFLHHATNYGGGGHGYGVELGRWTSDCLVTNNAFWHLRHAMLVHVGANGNVFSYNYSCESVSESGYLMPDISVHGHYSHANLFEGNAVHLIFIADYWGPAGPLTTAFRNRVCDVYRWGAPMAILVRDRSHRTNVVGNALARGAVSIADDVEDALVEGNSVQGKAEWRNVPPETTLPASLYLRAKPDFWNECPWPPFGPDVAPAKDAVIPAQERFVRLAGRDACDCSAAP